MKKDYYTDSRARCAAEMHTDTSVFISDSLKAIQKKYGPVRIIDYCLESETQLYANCGIEPDDDVIAVLIESVHGPSSVVMEPLD